MGFWVASTKKGGSRVKVRPMTVTRRSCMASSRADWVLAGARLISSASTMLANTGPLMNSNWRLPPAESSWMMSVPVMSAGIRSGVNWMRLKLRSSVFATELTSSVFARPGTPIRRACPRENRAMLSSSTTRCWPMIILLNSEESSL